MIPKTLGHKQNLSSFIHENITLLKSEAKSSARHEDCTKLSDWESPERKIALPGVSSLEDRLSSAGGEEVG
jgi:hypothetical protein